MTKKLLRGSVLAVAMISMINVEVSAKGNGNDGCFVPGYEEGHKGNQHKINIGYVEFETNMIIEGINFIRVSNNVDSNGWVTYHILDEDGKQIEVVHVRGEKPAIEGGELPEIGIDPETPVDPEEPEIEIPTEPVDPEAPEIEVPEVETPDEEEIITPGQEKEDDIPQSDYEVKPGSPNAQTFKTDSHSQEEVSLNFIQTIIGGILNVMSILW